MLNTPLIAYVGAFVGHHRLIAQLARWGYEMLPVTERDQLPERLLDRYPVLILVDGRDPDWQQWTTVIKSDQAVRRLHILIVTRDESIADRARSAGAEGVLDPDWADGKIQQHIRQHARLMVPDTVEQLRCQCLEPLPPLARLGVERFNAGAYYAQHDAFEAQWMAEPGPVRALYRAILQVGVAYYHLSRGNASGGLKMLRRCVQWFAVLPDECQGIDVRRLREDAAQVRASLLAADTKAGSSTFAPASFRPIRLIDTP